MEVSSLLIKEKNSLEKGIQTEYFSTQTGPEIY